VITAYHRPETIQEALALISRTTPTTLPLGGGTLLSHRMPDAVEVVDLQSLGLDKIAVQGNSLEIGATTTLQALLEHGSCPPALLAALKLEAPLNLRNAATVAGALVTCSGRSTFTTALLAIDAKLTLYSLPQSVPTGTDRARAGTAKEVNQNLGDFLPLRPHSLITSLTIPLQAHLAFEYVARTPADTPIVCVALAIWPSGRARLAVGGYGDAPRLAMDGTEAAGVEVAARNAYHDAGDEWGSAAYRMDIAATLSRRCLAALRPQNATG
jgi:CO/xanthine dehydrogenase FAD-binding subunit